jgi:hypothetical protein
VRIALRATAARRGFSPIAVWGPIAGVAALALATGCTGSQTRPASLAGSQDMPAATFSEDPTPLARYRSNRIAVSLPLPDGRTWRIDDHSRPELVASHAPTRSTVTVSVFHADDLVGRTQCEALARARGIVPTGDLRTLENEVAYTQQTFDTRVWVAVAPSGAPDGSLHGYVMAFGGFLRKCFAFVFSTEVDAASQEPALAARLAFARARILGGLVLEPFDEVGRSGR